jgi:hypothetical protein
MRTRLLIAMFVQIIAVLFSLMGWIDPLEGGTAVFIVGLLTVVAWAIGRVRIPRLTWISIVSALGIAVLTIALWLSQAQIDPNQLSGATEVSFEVRALLWLYLAASVAVIAGAVFNVITIALARRSTSA